MISHSLPPLPISPITGDTLGDPSQHLSPDLNSSFNNKKANALKDSYRSINPEELQHKVTEFLASKLDHSNYIQSQYDPEYHDQFCVCTDCIYERNLSKPSHSLFNLTMQSIYNQSFKNNSHKNHRESSPHKLNESLNQTLNPKQINQKQSSIHPKQTISFQTIYNQDMKKDTLPQKINTIVNEDNLKFQGPFTKFTTYGQKFPGIKGGNPYVKPLDKAVREKFNLNAKTTNQTFYRGQVTERATLTRSPDNIKTVQKFYNPPANSSVYNRAYKSIPKKLESFNDKNQFASTYEKSFTGSDLLEMVKHKKRLIRETMSRLGM